MANCFSKKSYLTSNEIAMNQSRREFITKGALAVGRGVDYKSYPLFHSSKKRPQARHTALYGSRWNEERSARTHSSRSHPLAYKNVEHAKLCRSEILTGSVHRSFKKILADLDLRMPSGHTVMDQTTLGRIEKGTFQIPGNTPLKMPRPSVSNMWLAHRSMP